MARLDDLKILITGDEAYGVFEEAVIDATDRIDMGFRIFDPTTRLRSEAGLARGDTWADLLVSKLDEGVRINIALSDFDPIVRPWLHQASWKSFSVFAGIAEMTTRPELLNARICDHPARVGWAPRLLLWPKVRGEISNLCDTLSGLTPLIQREALRCLPGLRSIVTRQGDSVTPAGAAAPELMPVSHHQKVAVIDDTVLYIGGLDLDRRRYDTRAHRGVPAQTWHDVQIMTRSPALARAARAHLEQFCAETAKTSELQSPPGLLRTLSTRTTFPVGAMSPDMGETGIFDRHLELIAGAERLIYLENQFLRDPALADALAARADAAPDLGLVLLLPAAPMELAFEKEDGPDVKYGEFLQAQCLDKLVSAYGDRFFAAAPVQPKASEVRDRSTLGGAPMIFVHSKVSVFDDTAAIVGSANLNGRSMRWDTELALELDDPGQVAFLRGRTMGTWLGPDAGREMTACECATVGRWRDWAERNMATHPESRQGFILPYDIKAARDFGTSLPGVPVEMV